MGPQRRGDPNDPPPHWEGWWAVPSLSTQGKCRFERKAIRNAGLRLGLRRIRGTAWGAAMQSRSQSEPSSQSARMVIACQHGKGSDPEGREAERAARTGDHASRCGGRAPDRESMGCPGQPGSVLPHCGAIGGASRGKARGRAGRARIAMAGGAGSQARPSWGAIGECGAGSGGEGERRWRTGRGGRLRATCDGSGRRGDGVSSRWPDWRG